MKKINILLIGVVIILVGASVYFLSQRSSDSLFGTRDQSTATSTAPSQDQTNETQNQEPVDETKTVIGTSLQKRDITAYHYGNGDTEMLFVGGVHGGYSWNTALLAYELMDYLATNPNVIPNNIRVTVIPVLNPDGLNKVTGTAGRFTQANVPSSREATIPGRFNANNVDLNRNFDCDWQSKGIWQNTTVSGGSKAFSEQESQAFKNYVETRNPAAVVVWYSAAGGVFASNCHNGVSPETRILTNTYAAASGYKAYDSFDFYEITGDMTNWLAKKNIPAISVMLSTHQDIEWNKNQAGIEALLKHYAE